MGAYSSSRYPPQQTFGVEDHEILDDSIHADMLNLTKAALVCSDRVVTVSPTFAKEMATEDGGCGFDAYARRKANAIPHRLDGVLNGIDEKIWDPMLDSLIFRNYSRMDFEEGKQENKAALQRIMGLDEDPSVPVISFIGKLTLQKGIDIVGAVLQWLLEDTEYKDGRVQMIMMGDGFGIKERGPAELVKRAELMYPGRALGFVGFDENLEHQIIAGCDLLLMPSRYEPCGMQQMYAQLYGTLPIATDIGGLKDSVKSIEDVGAKHATGFKVVPREDFSLKEERHGPSGAGTEQLFKDEILRALALFFKQRHVFAQMQNNAMRSDFYWLRAMDEYEEIIDDTLEMHWQQC